MESHKRKNNFVEERRKVGGEITEGVSPSTSAFYCCVIENLWNNTSGFVICVIPFQNNRLGSITRDQNTSKNSQTRSSISERVSRNVQPEKQTYIPVRKFLAQCLHGPKK